MVAQEVCVKLNLRVWQDERLGRRWRVAYADGDGETVVSFPDTDALGDFIVEHFGLELVDPLHDGYDDLQLMPFAQNMVY